MNLYAEQSMQYCYKLMQFSCLTPDHSTIYNLLLTFLSLNGGELPLFFNPLSI